MIKNRPGNSAIYSRNISFYILYSNGINILTPKRKKKVPFTTLTKPSSSKSPDGKSEKSDQSEPVQKSDPIVID